MIWFVRCLQFPGKEIHYKNFTSYSTNLASCGFSYYQNWKMSWKDKYFLTSINIYLHYWSYSRKQVPRIFLAMASSSHEVHTFIREVLKSETANSDWVKKKLLSLGHSRKLIVIPHMLIHQHFLYNFWNTWDIKNLPSHSPLYNILSICW